jgi:CheY-like chemotaxis protein/anti-sigma regulatory factor (Ser/Thr protein kinase)
VRLGTSVSQAVISRGGPSSPPLVFSDPVYAPRAGLWYIPSVPSPKTILVVDDDEVTHALLDAILEGTPCQVIHAADGEQALEALQRVPCDLVLTDIVMPGLSGLQLLERLIDRYPGLRVIVMTAENNPAHVLASIRGHAVSYLAKPLAKDAVLAAVDYALEESFRPDDIEVISAHPGWVSVAVRCKRSTAEGLAQFFRELAADLTPEDRDAVSVAFREILMNALEHGGRWDPKQRVRIAYIRAARSVIYYVADPGEGFSPGNLPHAAVANPEGDAYSHVEVRSRLGLRPGGFGLLMTRQLADELIYSEKGNEVMLIKYLDA